MENCIFCKIIKGELPCYKVYEDEKTIAFLDIAPTNPGHTLVLPRNHFENMEEIEEGELNALIQSVKKVGRMLKNCLEIEGYNITFNNGTIAGQVVPHIHFHVIPRHEGDRLELWPQGKFDDEWANNFIKQINNL
ncbi:MAG: HIT family protein [Candidatus Falkowbacteria bacterium]|nr:HIT family protein [Candidatus Falkowbacteria bacterium]